MSVYTEGKKEGNLLGLPFRSINYNLSIHLSCFVITIKTFL